MVRMISLDLAVLLFILKVNVMGIIIVGNFILYLSYLFSLNKYFQGSHLLTKVTFVEQFFQDLFFDDTLVLLRS